MKKKLDYLVFIQDTFYFSSFKKNLLSVSRQSIIITPVRDIRVVYAPKNSQLLNKKWYFFDENSFLFRRQFFYFPLFLLQLIRMFIYLIKNYNIEKVIVDNVYAAAVAGALRRFNFFQKTFYLGNDWLYDPKKKGILSRLSCNFLFLWADYLACRLNDVVYSNKYIFQERIKYWHKKNWKDGRIFNYWHTQIKDLSCKSNRTRNSILFLGVARNDSGFEYIFRALKSLNAGKKKYYFKIIGPLTNQLKKYLKDAQNLGISQYIQYLGFLPTHAFAKVASNCFCGINLITNTNSYTMYTTPSKVVYYLEYLLPVLITKGNGYLVTNLVKKYKLGQIVPVKYLKIQKSIQLLKQEENYYKKNIKTLIKANEKLHQKFDFI